MKMPFPILLATAFGCASEVDLPLDLDPGAEPPPDTDPDSPPDPQDPPPDPPPPTDELSWSRTDFPAPGSVEDVVWSFLLLGDFRVATPFAAELDPAGTAVGLNRMELPSAMLGPGKRVSVKDLTMAGEDLVGRLAWERIFPVRDASAPVPSGPTAAEVAPDGRIALGGNLTGFVDFGDGETGGGEDPVPFIAVFEPTGNEVD